MSLHFNKETLLAYVESIFPQISGEFEIDHLSEELLIVRLKVQERHLRPGGTVSGQVRQCSIWRMSAFISAFWLPSGPKH